MFDLQACRELLLLCAMAKQMIEREAIDSQSPRDFESTTAQVLKATARRSNTACSRVPQPRAGATRAIA